MTALLLKIAIPCIIFNSLATRPYEPDRSVFDLP